MISCDSPTLVTSIKEAVGNMASLWESAQLAVLLLRELPAQPKAYVRTPISLDDEQIGKEFGEMTLAIFKAHKSSIPMESWVFLRVGKIIKLRVQSCLICMGLESQTV